MERIVVLGCCGAGKSRFAAALGARLQLPVTHLDLRYVTTFRRHMRPKVLARIQQFQHGRRVVMLRKPSEAEDFLAKATGRTTDQLVISS